MQEPKLVGLCVLCEIPMCSARVKPPKGAWYDRHLGRRLCQGCYGVNRRAGTLHRFDRTTRPHEDTYAEWLLLRSTGATRRQAAGRMGMTVAALDHARFRMAVKRDNNLSPAERSGEIEEGDCNVLNSVSGSVTGTVIQIGSIGSKK